MRRILMEVYRVPVGRMVDSKDKVYKGGSLGEQIE
jgi:hypothetical protein